MPPLCTCLSQLSPPLSARRRPIRSHVHAMPRRWNLFGRAERESDPLDMALPKHLELQAAE